MKVWVVIEQEAYEVGPVQIVGVFSTEEAAERAVAEDDVSRSVYEAIMDVRNIRF